MYCKCNTWIHPNAQFHLHTHSNSLFTNFRQNLHTKVMDSPKPSSPIRVMDPKSSRMVISSGRLWFTENWAWTSMSLLQKNISSISFMQLVTSEFHHVLLNVNWYLAVALNTDTWHPASTSYKYCISQSKTKFTSSQEKIKFIILDKHPLYASKMKRGHGRRGILCSKHSMQACILTY